MVDPAADEACDTVDDTPGCDSDCTLPVCGDGHLNAFVEECDDGNTVNDGNGCGPNCKRTTCGNGTIEPGEFCDDGNLANLDGCSSTCETEVHEVEPNEDGTPSVSPFQQGFLGNDFASASADANGAFARTTTILAQIAPAGDEDVFAIDNPFADDRALLRAALRDPGTGSAVTCSFVPQLLFRDAAGTLLDGVAHFDGGDCNGRRFRAGARPADLRAGAGLRRRR